MYFACDEDMHCEGPGHNVMSKMFVPPPDSFVEDLTANMAVFGEEVSKEVIKVK